jgi:hypothetical protein
MSVSQKILGKIRCDKFTKIEDRMEGTEPTSETTLTPFQIERISKGLSWLLRHGLEKENIKIYKGHWASLVGYVNIYSN